MNTRAMTLIELLAVVAILALFAGIAVTAVPIGRGESGIHAALAEAVALDAVARLAARSDPHTPGSARVATGGTRVVLGDRGGSLAAIDSGGEVIARVVAPAGTSWTLEPLFGEPVNVIPIGREGRSIDYGAVLHTDGGETHRVDMLGLTGLLRKGGHP